MDGPGLELAMDRQNQVPVQQLIESIRVDFEAAMTQVMAAVNAAEDGRWIRDSEMPVHDIMGEFRAKVYQTALQMRVDMADKAASAESGDVKKKSAEQRG
jgi:hypothetical protein